MTPSERFPQARSSSSTTSGSSAGFIQQVPGLPHPTTTLRSSGTSALSWVSPGAQTDWWHFSTLDTRVSPPPLLLQQPLVLSHSQLRKSNAMFLLKSQKSVKENVFEQAESGAVTEAARLQSGTGSPSAPTISAEKNISFQTAAPNRLVCDSPPSQSRPPPLSHLFRIDSAPSPKFCSSSLRGKKTLSLLLSRLVPQPLLPSLAFPFLLTQAWFLHHHTPWK